MKLTFRSVSALALGAAIASPSFAQEQVDEETIIVTAQRENATEVRSGGDAGVLGDKPAEDLPFSIRSIDETLILNQQPLTLGEVLENDPTIRTTYGFGNAAEQFVVRGFSLFGDDVGLNGLYGIAPRQLIAPELYDSVQVLNGSTAFLNGAAPGGSGVGGSVNLVLKRADRADLNRATVSYVSQGHVGGSFDVSRRLAGDTVGVRVNGALRDGEVAIDNEIRETKVLGGAIDYDGGAFRAALDLAYQDVRVENLRPKVTLLSDAIPEVPAAHFNYAQDYTYTDLTDIFGTLSLEYDIDENVLAYAKAGARSGDEEGIYGGLQVTDATTGEATSGFHSFIPYEQDNQAVEAGIRAGFALGPTTHEFNVGGNLIWQEDRTAYDFFNPFATNLYDPVQVAPQDTAFVGGDLDDPFPITKRRLSSVFASDTVGLWDERILLTGGLRWQGIDIERFSYFGGGLDTVYDEDAVTPVVGIVVKPVSGLSLYANRIEGLQEGPVAPNEPGLTNPLAVLAPRMSTQYEIGGKLDLARGVFATLALYQIERPGEGTIDNADGSRTFAYVGDQTNRGIELTVIGEIAPGLRAITGFAVADAEFDSGLDAVGVPEFAANANLEWDVPFATGLTLTGRITHTGEQVANAANTLELDDWTVIDLGARYVFTLADRPLTLRAGVDNLLNEAYWASAFDAFNPALLQGSPRSFRTSLSIDF